VTVHVVIKAAQPGDAESGAECHNGYSPDSAEKPDEDFGAIVIRVVRR